MVWLLFVVLVGVVVVCSFCSYIFSHLPRTILVLLPPSYPGMRWFTTLLAREFDMPDCLRLWDSLFAHIYQTKTLEFLVSICANIVLSQSEVLMAGALNVSCLCLLLATQLCLFLFHTCIDSLVCCFLFSLQGILPKSSPRCNNLTIA